MNRNKLAAPLALGAALIFSGCAGASGNSATSNNNNGDAAQSRESATSDAQSVGSATNNSPSASSPSSSPSAAGVGNPISQTGAATPKDGAGVNPNARAATAPKPQIGSGGNDFYLFTQARAALAADPELKGANFILEVKEGVLTLSGAVASAEQKSRAEQVVRGVSGVKSVKNQIKVSAGG